MPNSLHPLHIGTKDWDPTEVLTLPITRKVDLTTLLTMDGRPVPVKGVGKQAYDFFSGWCEDKRHLFLPFSPNVYFAVTGEGFIAAYEAFAQLHFGPNHEKYLYLNGDMPEGNEKGEATFIFHLPERKPNEYLPYPWKVAVEEISI